MQPLNEALKMSEAGGSHLGHVLPCWMAIAEHLRMRRMDYPNELTLFICVDNNEGFAHRYKRQVLLLHIAAYYLLPENHTKPIPENFNNQLQAFFVNIPPPKPISRCYAMNSRVSEHRNLHSSMDVDVRRCQKCLSCSDIP